MSSDSPPEVDALHAGVARLFDLTDELGRKAGNCTRGVCLFVDYDGEPIYVGQTTEKLRTRIRRHPTNQRTDAVAMRVLDPFEVAEVEMWGSSRIWSESRVWEEPERARWSTRNPGAAGWNTKTRQPGVRPAPPERRVPQRQCPAGWRRIAETCG